MASDTKGLTPEVYAQIVKEVTEKVTADFEEKNPLDDMVLIAGRSNLELSELISQKLGVPLAPVDYKEFGNTETYIQIKKSIRKANVFIIQTGGPGEDRPIDFLLTKLYKSLETILQMDKQDPTIFNKLDELYKLIKIILDTKATYKGLSINDHIIELFEIIDACKRSGAKSISVVLPTYPYARADKKVKAHESISAKLISKLLTALGVTRIISVDLHNPATQGYTDDSFDNLYAIKLHIDYLKNHIFKGLSHDEINQQYFLCAPDAGADKRCQMYAEKLGMEHVIMHKQRDYSKVSVVLESRLIGDPETVKNKIAIMVDDLCDTMGTMSKAGDTLKTYGVKGMIVVATHGVFSHPAFDIINASDMILEVVVTNTLPQTANKQKTTKLQVVDISDLLAQVIFRVHTGGSVSELFD